MGNAGSTKAYKYANKKVPYRSEKLEISKPERKILDEWLKLSLENKDKGKEKQNDPPLAKHKVIFDTDIGTDIDDSLALLMLLHLPAEHFLLLGVTTVYGYTAIRAAVAKEILEAYYGGKWEDDVPVPVIAGESVPLGTHREVWHTGTEGIGLFEANKIEEMKKATAEKGTHEAADFIIKKVLEHPGEVELICLGGLTNIAVALRRNPKIIPLIKRIVYMGMGHRMSEKQTDDYYFKGPNDDYEPGFIYFHYPNHNVSCDTLAAVEVFRSGVPVTVVNDAVTNTLWFGMKPNRNDEESVKSPVTNPCAALMQAIEPPECKVVGSLLSAWLSYRSSIFYTTMRGTCPHDAITTAEAVYPGRFAKYVKGRLLVHEWAGFSSFVLDPQGPHEIGCSAETDSFLAFLIPLLVPFWSPPPPSTSTLPSSSSSTVSSEEANITHTIQNDEEKPKEKEENTL